MEITRLPSLKFSTLFAAATSRTEVVVTFLAVLELIRLKIIQAVQTENFGEIEIVRAPEPEPLAEAQPEEALVDAAPRGEATEAEGGTDSASGGDERESGE
jgi:segregation and condensation protein A